MKKFTLSFWFIAASAGYALYAHLRGIPDTGLGLTAVKPRNTTVGLLTSPTATVASPQHPVAEPSASVLPRTTPPPIKPPSQPSAPTQKPTATPAPTPAQTLAPKPTPLDTPQPTPTPTPKPKGLYADGTYTGSRADAYYGIVQVQATIQNSKITDVVFLSYPNDRRTSQNINAQAMPYLTSEAIQAQSANVDIVSGATDTSEAFRQSLADALAQARA